MFKKSIYKDIKGIRVAGAIITGMVLSTAVVGVLFKIMMWAGASAMLFVNVIPVLVLVIISAIKYSKSKDAFYKRILIRTLLFGGLCFIFLSLPANTILKIRYRCCPEYVNAVIAASDDPDNEALQQKAREEEDKMSRMAGNE
jgi:cytochrome c oxidase subunit IV